MAIVAREERGGAGGQIAFVETIPAGVGLAAHGESTADALMRLVHDTEETIDITAMYWSLLPTTENPDVDGWDAERLVREFDAGRGEDLYEALRAAAGRGVRIRICESPGFDDVGSDGESATLARGPSVERRVVDLAQWYGSGIIHQKVWIFDGRAVYLGSANNDWRSLSQVKELGLVAEDVPVVADEATRLFETWWRLGELDPEKHRRTTHDGTPVPAWSMLVPASERLPSPLADPDCQGRFDWEHPARTTIGGDAGEIVVAAAPEAVCVGRRSHDLDAVVGTLHDAGRTVCVNVMDFAPVSLYRAEVRNGEIRPAPPSWWPDIYLAIVSAVARGVDVRLLVSQWQHTSPYVAPFLGALRSTADAVVDASDRAPGTLQIRRFTIPGWDRTGPRGIGDPPADYPGHTRVNHAKYVVTERRGNVGTSNFTGDYFFATGGASINFSHPQLVRQLQRLFDRDWDHAARN